MAKISEEGACMAKCMPVEPGDAAGYAMDASKHIITISSVLLAAVVAYANAKTKLVGEQLFVVSSFFYFVSIVAAVMVPLTLIDVGVGHKGWVVERVNPYWPLMTAYGACVMAVAFSIWFVHANLSW